MIVAIACNKHGFKKGSFCDECEMMCPDVVFGNVFNSHDVEIEPGKRFHVGSKKDEKILDREHGIARYEDVKERAKQANTRKEYKLSEETKKLHGYIKSHGVSWNFVEKHMPQHLPTEKNRERLRRVLQTNTK